MPAARALVLAAVLGLALSQSCFYPVEGLIEPPIDEAGSNASGGSLSVEGGEESEGCGDGERCVRAESAVVLLPHGEFCTTISLKQCSVQDCDCDASGGDQKDAECTEMISRAGGECNEWVGANNHACTPMQPREFASARSYVSQKHHVTCNVKHGSPTLQELGFCAFEPRKCEGDPTSVCVARGAKLLLPSATGVWCPAGYATTRVFEPQPGVEDPSSCTCDCEKCTAAAYLLYSEENCTDEWPMRIEADEHCRALPRTAIRYELVGYRKCQPYARMIAPNKTLCTPVRGG